MSSQPEQSSSSDRSSRARAHPRHLPRPAGVQLRPRGRPAARRRRGRPRTSRRGMAGRSASLSSTGSYRRGSRLATKKASRPASVPHSTPRLEREREVAGPEEGRAAADVDAGSRRWWRSTACRTRRPRQQAASEHDQRDAASAFVLRQGDGVRVSAGSAGRTQAGRRVQQAVRAGEPRRGSRLAPTSSSRISAIDTTGNSRMNSRKPRREQPDRAGEQAQSQKVGK